jgi:DNA-binding response OmpR family regulator
MASEARGARPRLLIVDDEESILQAIGDYFEAQGFDVDRARDAAAARQCLDLNVYAGIIADLRLSGSQSSEGLEILEWTRRRSPATRTIILTAYGSVEVEREARWRGADALIHKPVRLAELARVVARLLREERGDACSGCPHNGSSRP